MSGVNEKGPTLRLDLSSGSSVVKHLLEIVLMRGLLAFVAWSFCISIGAASFATEHETEMSDDLKTYLRIAFCEALSCHNSHHIFASPEHCRVGYFNNTTFRKFLYVLDEAKKQYPYGERSFAEENLKKKFLADLEKAQVMDGFEFTQQHTEDCFNDLQNLFEENYEPTFNIELLK